MNETGGEFNLNSVDAPPHHPTFSSAESKTSRSSTEIKEIKESKESKKNYTITPYHSESKAFSNPSDAKQEAKRKRRDDYGVQLQRESKSHYSSRVEPAPCRSFGEAKAEAKHGPCKETTHLQDFDELDEFDEFGVDGGYGSNTSEGKGNNSGYHLEIVIDNNADNSDSPSNSPTFASSYSHNLGEDHVPFPDCFDEVDFLEELTLDDVV